MSEDEFEEKKESSPHFDEYCLVCGDHWTTCQVLTKIKEQH